jgi:hypothetical protein
MRTFGIIVIVLGIAACLVAMLLALDVGCTNASIQLAAAIAALGIVAAGGILLHHSK